MTSKIYQIALVPMLLLASGSAWSATIDPCTVGPCLIYQYQRAAGSASVGPTPDIHSATPLTISDSASSGGDSAAFTGTVNFQNLHLTASATADSSTFSVYSSPWIEFIDYLEFTSSTLPVGTPVDYLVTAELHDTISTDETCPTGASGAQLEVSGGLVISDNICNPINASQRTRSVLLHTVTTSVGGFLGSDPTLVATLSMTAYAGTFFKSTHSVVDASNTGLVYVTVLTPGVDFKSASGASYAAAAVPDPAM